MRRLVRSLCVLVTLLLIGTTTGRSQAPPPPNFTSASVNPSSGSFSELPFERIDLATGTLSLEFSELSLPGNAGMNLTVVRAVTDTDWSFGVTAAPKWVDLTPTYPTLGTTCPARTSWRRRGTPPPDGPPCTTSS